MLRISIVLFLTISLAAFAGDLPFSTKEELKIFDKQVGPGLSYIVMKNDQIIESESFGYADIRKKQKITKKSKFIIASLSKQFTAMAVLLLEQEGKLSTEDQAIKYLPELPQYSKEIKIKHLLNHQSGLPDYSTLCSESAKPVGNSEIMAFLKTKTQIEFTPGTQFEYSNTGYVVLAEIVAKVSGTSFSTFMTDKIFKKLGMNDTSLVSVDTEPSFQKQMHSYSDWPFFKLEDANPCNYKLGPGSVISTLFDYSLWAKAIRQNKLINPELTLKMFTPAKLNDGKDTGYSDGWVIASLDENKLIWHNGAWLSFRTYAGYLPEKNIWVALFSNYGGLDVNTIGKQLLREALK